MLGTKKCIVCGKPFEGVDRDVCSWQCDENRSATIRKRLGETIKNDKSHTKKLSEGSDNKTIY